MPVLELDDVRWAYYAEIGYDPPHAQQLLDTEGLPALIAYWKPFEIHAVERVLESYQGHVIAFGAGHSFYDDLALLQRAQQALAPCRHVILLEPSSDIDTSMAVLAARFPAYDPFAPVMWRVQAEMLRHPANRTLATLTVYTVGKTPEQICEEIVAKVAVC
jgi:hypothetical protein